MVTAAAAGRQVVVAVAVDADVAAAAATAAVAAGRVRREESRVCLLLLVLRHHVLQSRLDRQVLQEHVLRLEQRPRDRVVGARKLDDRTSGRQDKSSVCQRVLLE